MVSHTYYTKADLWVNDCRFQTGVDIIVSNGKDGKKTVRAPELDPKFSGEADLFFSVGIMIMLLNGEGYYAIFNNRHHPQDSAEEMFKNLSGA